MPRSCSIFIQSDLARRASPRALTRPAAWIAPPSSSRCSVKVVLPASGWEMIAKVRLLAASLAGVLLMRAGVANPGFQSNWNSPLRGLPRPHHTPRSNIHLDAAYREQGGGKDD